MEAFVCLIVFSAYFGFGFCIWGMGCFSLERHRKKGIILMGIGVGLFLLCFFASMFSSGIVAFLQSVGM